MTPTTFLHLTDLHLVAPGHPGPAPLSDVQAHLRRMVALIGAMDPAPDFLVLSGDLTDHGDAPSYALLRRLMDGLPMPLVPTLGNHDARGAFRGAFPGLAPGDAETPCFHQARLAGLHVIVLDTSLPGRVGGAIGAAQFAQLDAALARWPGIPKLLVLHHPPRISGDALAWEALEEGETEELAALLAGRGVAGLLCGHTHVNRCIHWHGIPVVITAGLQASFDPLTRSGLQIEDATGFALCTHRASGLDVTFVPLTPERRVLGRIDGDLLEGFR